MEHLTKKPDGSTYQEKSIRLDLREKLANKLLGPVLDSLHPTLVLSIVLFIVGLLYQLWSLSLSPHRSTILILTSAFGSALVFCMTIISGSTHIHGIFREESPFTTSVSLGIRQLLPKNLFSTTPTLNKDPFLLFCTTVMQVAESDNYDQVSSVRFFDDRLLQKKTDRLELATDVVVHVLASDASLEAKQTVAWNLREISEAQGFYKKTSKVHIKCCKRLWTALYSSFKNAPYNEMNARLSFFVIGAVVLLQFSGVRIVVFDLDNKTLKIVFLKLFMLRREEHIDADDLVWAKFEATVLFELLLKEDPRLLDGVVDEYPDLLLAIVKDSVSIQWKRFIIPQLREEDVARLIDLVSVESSKQDADFLYLVRILSLVVEKRNVDLVFSEHSDFSKIVNYLASGDGFEYRGVDLLSGAELDGFLSLLISMNDQVLALQSGLLDFLNITLEKLGSQDAQRFFNHGKICSNTSTLHSRVVSNHRRGSSVLK